ncbi:ATP-binding protein [Leptolyngbya sp. AN02str]|uniref:sensor histidine kinase n=1 Tax=Leptolyngbya sp. AN02str TaxID=3423363 RepID=UPI003D318FDC
MTSQHVNDPPSTKVRKLALRLLLIIPFVLQIMLAVSLVGYLSFLNGQKAVNELAYELVNKAKQQVDDHLDFYLSLPHQLNQLNADAIASGQLQLKDRAASEKHFWSQASVFDTINYIGYILTDGSQVGAGRYLNGRDLVIFENLPGKGKAADYLANEEGGRAQLIQRYDYDPLPDYQGAFQAQRPTWSPIFVAEINNTEQTDSAKGLQINDTNPNFGIQYYATAAATYPIYTRDRTFLGLFNVDVLLNGISQYLQTLRVSPSGEVFILDRQGLMVGSSDPDPILYRNQDTTQRYAATQSPNALIQSVAQVLQQRFPDLSTIQSPQRLQVNCNGQRQFIEVSPWKEANGLDWLVVVSVPESDFMAQINANTRLTIWLCLGSLVAAIVIGIFTSRWIVKPMARLRNAAEAIAQGNLNQQIEPTGIAELEAVRASFNHMAQQLRDSFAELETNNAELENRVAARTEELSQALVDLRQTQSKLIQNEKMSSLGQLVAGVAHEINNPVNFIRGNLNHAQEYTNSLLHLIQLYRRELPHPSPQLQHEIEDVDLEFLCEDFPNLLTSMTVGADRIQEIIKSLRNFSRLDEADIKSVNIHEGIDSTLMILQNRLKSTGDRAGILIQKHYGDLPLVECYPGQLNQVFMNLLSNAIDAIEEHHVRRKASHEPSPSISIFTKLIEADCIEIRIADTGTGIDPSICDKLFDPFFTTKPVGKGTGLGLSISYQIVVEKHGGNMYCQSNPGQGTEFVVQLPIQVSRTFANSPVAAI